jgi:hypothetical protein
VIKKVLLVAAVIVSGLMVGVIISGTTSKKASENKNINNTTAINQTDTSTDNTQIASSDFTASLSALPTSIKAAGTLNANTEYEKIDKTTLDVTYSNKTSSDLKGVEIWLRTEGENSIGVAVSENVKFDKEKSANNVYVFDASDAPLGASNTARIFLFIRNKGQVKVSAEVKTSQGKNTVTNSVDLIAN